MGHALLEAAREAGIRITLLDTLYLSGGFGKPPQGVQARYSDGSAAGLGGPGRRDRRRPGARASGRRCTRCGPCRGTRSSTSRARQQDVLHVHLSEQVAENEACQEAYGVTPTRLLAAHGLLRPTTTLVHATHLTAADIALIGEADAYVDFCPTTERDLGDGVGPSRRLADAGRPADAGLRQPRGDRPLRGDARGRARRAARDHAPRALVGRRAAHRRDRRPATPASGWTDAGSIAVGQRADLVTLDLASPRTAGAGTDEHAVVFAASAGDVLQVVADGELVHTRDQVGEIGRELDRVIKAVHG